LATAIESPTAGGKTENAAHARIIAAAIEIFGSFGFAKSTIQEIAATAHVSKPLFYRHFDHKQDLFERVVERVFIDWREALVERVARSEGNIETALGSLLVTALQYGQARPLLGRLLTRDSQVLLSTQSDVWAQACEALRQLIGDLLEKGVRAGEIRADLPIEHMADFLTEIHFTFANRQILTGVAVDPNRAQSIVACMLDGVKESARFGR
jgi:TetR/AcrR family transcriptional regulator, repressor for uid operon